MYRAVDFKDPFTYAPSDGCCSCLALDRMEGVQWGRGRGGDGKERGKETFVKTPSI